MGTLQATMPDGALIEREMGCPDRYSHGLAILRGDQWVLLSVHKSHANASKNLKRLERCFCGGPAFGEYPEIEVVPLVRIAPRMSPKVRDPWANHPQQSRMVSPATAA